MLRLEKELGGLAGNISEIDVSSPDNLRITVPIGRRAVDLMLGGGSFARRYQNFLDHYTEIRRRSPNATTFDLRLDDRITAKE